MRQTLKSACGRKNVLILSFWLLAVVFIRCSVFFYCLCNLTFFFCSYFVLFGLYNFFFNISNVICSVYRHYFTQSISVFPFQHLSYLKRSLVSFINNHSNKFNINENKNFDVNSCSKATKETKTTKKRNNNDNNHKVNKENRQHIWNIIYNIVSQIWHILGWTITRMQIHLGIIDDDWLKFGVFKWNKYGIWHATRRFNSLKYLVWATRPTKI